MYFCDRYMTEYQIKAHAFQHNKNYIQGTNVYS